LEEKELQQATDVKLGGVLEIETIVCNQGSRWHTTISDDLAPPMSLMSESSKIGSLPTIWILNPTEEYFPPNPLQNLEKVLRD